MKHIFRVTIHYNDGSKNQFDTIARDDTQARSKAIAYDAKSWDNAKQPKVDYCEITRVTTADA